MYIKFLDSKTPIECLVKQIAPNIVELRFADEIIENISGFRAYLDKKCEYDIGGNFYINFNTMYRNDESTLSVNGYQLSNNNSKYVPTQPLPESETHVPTEEELQAIFQQNKKTKIELSKQMLAEFLENNPIISTAHGGVEGTYSVTSEKQSLMTSQYMTYQIEKEVNPDAVLTWNEKGKSCEIWTEAEFLQLVLEIKAYVYPKVSHQQGIEESINECSTQEELDAIVIDYSAV